MSKTIMTRERAEKLAKALTGSGLRVTRLDGHPMTGHRTLGNGIIVNIFPYARVFRGAHLVTTIHHETIDPRSVLL